MGHNNIYSGSRIIQYRNNLEFNYGIRIFTGIIDPKRSIVHPSITVNETTCCHRVQLELTYSTYFKVLIYINIPVYITKTLPCQQKRKKRQPHFYFSPEMGLKVLSALDTAKTQLYHFKAIIVAGMGLFTDAYDLFCIPLILGLIGRVYYEQDEPKYQIPPGILSATLAIALLGTAIGQLVFGRLGDRIGRRRVYGIALMIMVLSSLGCGFSICKSRECVLVSLSFFRFFLGVGIGGDYPLSATIMSEFANRRTRGAFIAAVFSMQGFGILAGSTVTMVVCAIFEHVSRSHGHGDTSHTVSVNHTPKGVDIAWRLILMLGAVPAALTYYWRMMMPETAR